MHVFGRVRVALHQAFGLLGCALQRRGRLLLNISAHICTHVYAHVYAQVGYYCTFFNNATDPEETTWGVNQVEQSIVYGHVYGHVHGHVHRHVYGHVYGHVHGMDMFTDMGMDMCTNMCVDGRKTRCRSIAPLGL